MSATMAFFLGMFVGGCAGIFFMGCCFVASRADESMEKENISDKTEEGK